MKKSIKNIMFAVTAVALSCTFAVTGCTEKPPVNEGGGEASNWQDNMHREENDFLQDDNRRPSREPFVDNTPEEEEGATLTPVRFEAEHAKIRGTTNGEDHFCTGKSIEFSPSFSDNITLCNLGTATLSFTFTSSKAVRSKLLIRMSNQYAGEDGIGTLSSYANMTVNDKPVVDLSAEFNSDDAEPASGSSSSYFTMITAETKISLAEGKNVLAITPASANWLNLDYIEIYTSAAIEDKTDSTIKNPSSFVNVSTVPTEEAGGKISFTCHNNMVDGAEAPCKNDNARARNLPALTDPIYTKQTLDNGIRHTAKMFGEDVVISSSVVWDLTLDGATFEDGSTIAQVAPGTTPVIKYNVPEGQIFSHWVDGDGNELGSVFVMPDKAITIKPVFVDATTAVTVTLQGATLDGKNTLQVLPGTVTSLVGAQFNNQPQGTELYCWYDADNPETQFKNPAAIEIGTKNITLAPAFDLITYANKDGSTTGKVSIFPRNGYAEMLPGGSVQPVGGYVRLQGENGVKAGKQSAYWGVVGNEMGAVYHWTTAEGSTDLKDFYFTPISPYKVVSSKTYTIKTTLQNNGDKEIKLKLYQTNSSGTPKPAATASGEITLAAGEVKTVDITFKGFGNSNIMTTVELLTEGITDLKLGLYQYIDDGTPAPATYTLTLENATLADGSSTGKFEEGATPELKYTLPENTEFSHWADADGKNLGTDFTMPNKDITIHPVFVNVYTLTLEGGATLAGGATSGTFREGAKPEIIYTTPEGQIFSHWEDAEGTNLGETFTMPGKNITVKPVFINPNAVTVTLDGATLGGKNTISITGGSTLDLTGAVFTEQPEDTVLYYWYNANNPKQYFEDASAINIPNEDITLAPAFDLAAYANKDGSTTGRLSIFPRNGYAEMLPGSGVTQPEGGYVRNIDAKGVKAGEQSAYWGLVNGTMGAIYHWTVAEGAENLNGFYFTALSPYRVNGANKYVISTTIENQGDAAITLKVYQTNSSGTPKPDATASEEFTLQKNENRTVDITFTNFSNGNIMTTVEVLSDVTDLKIGMYQSIAKVSHTLTLGEGATFENGESLATVAVGDQPKFIYNEPDHKAFSHWEDAEHNELELPFVMPDEDFAIYPVFIDSTDVEITLQGATFNGSSTVNTVAKRVLDLSQAVITGGVPEGKVLKGWYDVSDRTKVYSVSFTVPEGETLTLAPVFDSDKIFYSDKTYAGKIEATGKLHSDTGKTNGCYTVGENYTTGAINSGNGYYEVGSVYRFKGGTAEAPAEKMAVGSYFVTQEMNGKTGSGDNNSLANPLVATTTVENFGSEDVTLRFALITSSGNPNSQYGEATVTIKAGESSTFTFDITKLHGSFMLNVMVKDTEVSEVYIGVYQYISAKA